MGIYTSKSRREDIGYNNKNRYGLEPKPLSWYCNKSTNNSKLNWTMVHLDVSFTVCYFGYWDLAGVLVCENVLDQA